VSQRGNPPDSDGWQGRYCIEHTPTMVAITLPQPASNDDQALDAGVSVALEDNAGLVQPRMRGGVTNTDNLTQALCGIKCIKCLWTT